MRYAEEHSDWPVDTCRVSANSHCDCGKLNRPFSCSVFELFRMQIPGSYKLNTKYIFSIHIIGMRKMSIKKMLHSKKAISPILATLLLIVIAVAAIVVTYAWITTY